jgi:hypothetical protein
VDQSVSLVFVTRRTSSSKQFRIMPFRLEMALGSRRRLTIQTASEYSPDGSAVRPTLEGGRWHACTTIPGVMMISRPLSGLGLAIWREKENTFVGHDG